MVVFLELILHYKINKALKFYNDVRLVRRLSFQPLTLRSLRRKSWLKKEKLFQKLKLEK